MKETWTIQMLTDGGCIIRDGDGKVRGHYATPDIMAAHMAFLIEENESLTSAINSAITRLENDGIGERAVDTLRAPLTRNWQEIEIPTV